MLREGALALVALALMQDDRVEAHHHGSHIPLGGACRHTNPCLHHAPASRRGSASREWVYCADNGFRYDGAFNCCRHRGGSCERDEHCCGTREFCRNRICTYLR
jgi:hypothetical protein